MVTLAALTTKPGIFVTDLATLVVLSITRAVLGNAARRRLPTPAPLAINAYPRTSAIIPITPPPPPPPSPPSPSGPDRAEPKPLVVALSSLSPSSLFSFAFALSPDFGDTAFLISSNNSVCVVSDDEISLRTSSDSTDVCKPPTSELSTALSSLPPKPKPTSGFLRKSSEFPALPTPELSAPPSLLLGPTPPKAGIPDKPPDLVSNPAFETSAEIAVATASSDTLPSNCLNNVSNSSTVVTPILTRVSTITSCILSSPLYEFLTAALNLLNPVGYFIADSCISVLYFSLKAAAFSLACFTNFRWPRNCINFCTVLPPGIAEITLSLRLPAPSFVFSFAIFSIPSNSGANSSTSFRASGPFISVTFFLVNFLPATDGVRLSDFISFIVFCINL